MKTLVLTEVAAFHIRALRDLGQRQLLNVRFEQRSCGGTRWHREQWARVFLDLARESFARAAALVRDERRRIEGLVLLRSA